MAAVTPCAAVRPRLPHPGKVLLFAVLSLTDLAFTWFLVENGRGQFYESNPVAAWCLHGQGWLGLAAFKALAVLLTLGAVLAIARRCSRTAGRVLVMACATVAAVVLYSGYLHRASAASIDILRSEERNFEQLCDELARTRDLPGVIDRVVGDLAHGRRTLAEAVDELEPAARTPRQSWLKGLRVRFGDLPDRQVLAAFLIHRCVRAHKDNPRVAQELGRRLAEEYAAVFGTRLPMHCLHQPTPRQPVPEGLLAAR